ncbi:MAG: response regulator [Anaerolineae bacterium]|nr:response regulator [Anaerolineae bacterium]
MRKFLSFFKRSQSSARSLVATLGIAFLALSVGVLLIAGLLQGYLNFQAQRAAVSDRQRLIAQEASSTVSSFIQEKFGIMETAVKLSNPATVSTTVQLRVLETLLNLHPSLRHMVLFDAQGQESVKASNITLSAVDGFVAQLKEDGLTQLQESHYIGPVYLDATTSEPLSVIGVSAFDVFGDFQGTLVAEVNLKFMWDLVDSIQVGESGEAYVVDRQGYLIALRDNLRVLRGENVADRQAVAEFIRSSGESAATLSGISRGVNDTLVVATYVPLGTPDWAVIVEMPWGEAYQGVISNLLYTLVIMLVVGTGASLIGRFLARRLSVPLVNLTGIASQIAEGSLDLEAAVAGPSEVISLSMAFNSMTGQLRSLIGTLEERVEDRTRQMAHSKEEAEKAKEHAEEARSQVELQMWQATGQARLSERIAGSQGIAALANNVVKQLCQYLQVQVGALYLLEDKILRLQGRYAHGGGDGFRDRFSLNEGLVGEAAAGREMYRLSNLPQDTLPLASSFGEIVLQHSVAAPFVYEGQVLGVVELGSLQEFTPAQLQFIGTAMERVGVAFSTALARARVDELLARTQQMTEELQSQSEELRVANEELASQTENLSRSEGELREKQVQLESINAELEEKAIVLQEHQNILNRQNQDLKTAQDELERKAQELAQASKYKSEFLANMSHELRTPLNSLLILAGMLRKNESGNLSADQIESLTVIHNSGRDLLELINEILDLSKIEAGRMEFRFEPLPLRDLVDAMATQFTHVAEQKGLEFTLQLAGDLPRRIVGDIQRISQIVKNLLSNAFKFTERGGVYLEVRRPQHVPASMPLAPSPERTVAISVRDTGIGISKDKLKIIFEAFQQADGSTSRKYGGTGLGLSISRELAFRMGGIVDVVSTPGQGSTFTLYLPETWSVEDGERIDPTRESSPPAPDLPGEPAAPVVALPKNLPLPAVTFPDDREQLAEGDRVLLIVEDDMNFAKVVYDHARRKGFRCLVAGDGESGLSLVKTYHPDAMLLDLRLPGMSGWMVLQQLKDDPDTRHIPVHIMSVEERVLDAYKRGAMGFLTKPVSVEDLTGVLGKIEQFIEREVKSLLVVEDDVNLRHSVKKLLEGSDVKIIEVGTGQQALDTLRSAHVDCMILDLSLPDMSGFEVLRSLHDDESVPKCPVIVYTGQALDPEEHQQLLLYADSVIVKEVKSPERLLDETSLFLHRVVATMSAEKQQVIKQMPDRDAVFQGKRILVVDDDMRNSFALSKLLRDKGIVVQVAADGRRALELLEKNPDMDLVLMDIMMPIMDGYETIRQIRAQARFRALPILALTAKAMKGDREKCLEAGASDYLPKPVDEDRLFSMLRVWLYH